MPTHICLHMCNARFHRFSISNFRLLIYTQVLNFSLPDFFQVDVMCVCFYFCEFYFFLFTLITVFYVYVRGGGAHGKKLDGFQVSLFTRKNECSKDSYIYIYIYIYSLSTLAWLR